MSSYGVRLNNTMWMVARTSSDTETLRLTPKEEREWLVMPQDICWIRGGKVGVLLKAVIQNAVNLRNEKRQLGLPQAALQFGWDEVISAEEGGIKTVRRL